MEKLNMYHKGKIYKIVNDINDDIYIGSTVKQLSNRMGGHRSCAKTKTSHIYNTMRELGIEHFKIILVESFKCDNREELLAREDYYIQLLKPALNMISAVFNIEKRVEYQIDYNKIYYNEHKDKTLEKGKIRFHCDFCDCDVTMYHKSSHNKTKKHLTNSKSV
jgi:group I intron endonuclease